MSASRIKFILVVTAIPILLFAACTKISPTPTNINTEPIPTDTVVESPEPSQTPFPPSPTPIPLAATINGEPVTLAEYEAELARFQASTAITGTNLASDPGTIVLNELIDQTLLAQAAAQNGFMVDETLLQEKITTLEAQLGGAQKLEDWISSHGYTLDEFEQALKRSAGAAWMRDQIISAVPETADEVHVRQILLRSAEEANQVFVQLQSGADFEGLAADYDPLTKGDLGWFPRGYLDLPAIDEVVFALQPGQYSAVVETDIGYHILFLIERDANHTLQPDARQMLQVNALKDWLDQRREESVIEILLPSGVLWEMMYG
jgi:hypothetical protein